MTIELNEERYVAYAQFYIRFIESVICEKEKSETDIVLLEIINTMRLMILSAALGIVTGIYVRPPEGLLIVVFPVIGLIFLSGMMAVMLIIARFRFKSADKYIIPMVKMFISLVIFLVTLSIASINRSW